jgi:SAM-dependent methyltransferase
MVLFNTIEMILQENNTTKTQLKKWYKSPAGQHYRKIILNELESIKDLYQGRHALFCGSSEYKKLFQKNKSGTFFSIDEDVLISSANLSKNLPFEDNSHDVIVLSHGLEYTENPYLLMREIDRIATDDATIVVIGFNKFSLWSLIKIFSSKPPWNINFLSPYIIKEWFKILEYKTNYQKTFGFIPYLGKKVTSFLSSISFLHKIIRNQFGGLAMFTYRKRVIPLTPQKIIFNKNYKAPHLAKNNI